MPSLTHLSITSPLNLLSCLLRILVSPSPFQAQPRIRDWSHSFSSFFSASFSCHCFLYPPFLLVRLLADSIGWGRMSRSRRGSRTWQHSRLLQFNLRISSWKESVAKDGSYRKKLRLAERKLKTAQTNDPKKNLRRSHLNQIVHS